MDGNIGSWERFKIQSLGSEEGFTFFSNFDSAFRGTTRCLGHRPITQYDCQNDHRSLCTLWRTLRVFEGRKEETCDRAPESRGDSQCPKFDQRPRQGEKAVVVCFQFLLPLKTLGTTQPWAIVLGMDTFFRYRYFSIPGFDTKIRYRYFDTWL